MYKSVYKSLGQGGIKVLSKSKRDTFSKASSFQTLLKSEQFLTNKSQGFHMGNLYGQINTHAFAVLRKIPCSPGIWLATKFVEGFPLEDSLQFIISCTKKVKAIPSFFPK